jgi:DNA-binding NtrC family response regulator
LTEKFFFDDEPECSAFEEDIYQKRLFCNNSAVWYRAWRFIEEDEVRLIISDMAMKDMSGIELLKLVRSSDLNVPFIIITGVGTIETAV